MTRPIRNLAIMASAGTGKTFRLAMRYLTLLKLGVEPDEIVAMTFTNKAAGEIFDKIIQEILVLSGDPERLREQIRTGMLPPGTTPEDLFVILQKILCSPKKLQISTFDSFFFNIISAFPMECGIAGEITMLSEKDDEQRIRTLLSLIRDSDENERHVLLELVKQAGMNLEPYSIFAPAQKIVKNYYEAYLKFPEERLWIRLPELVPEIRPEDRMSDSELMKAKTLFQESADQAPKGKRFFDTLVHFAEAAVSFARNPVSPYLTPVETLAKTDPDWMSHAGSMEFPYGKGTIVLPGEILRTIQQIMRHLLAVEYERISNQNIARYHLIRRFDRQYGAQVRQNGNLTFKDIVFLLRPESDGTLALPFSDRTVLEERLDAVYHHYLIDEFQDTSDEQWRAISNLADEIFQPDPDRFRSFFYVGDIKQSIYQWRDGNPKLFGMLYKRYSDPGFADSSLERQTMELSYRSSVPVIETVNRVFEHPELVANKAVRQAMEKMAFKRHSSSSSAARQPGFAALIACSAEEMNTVPAESVFSLLESIDPFAPGRSCTVGILTRSNEFARSMAEQFREFAAKRGRSGEFAISVEGVLLLNASMVFTVFRNLLEMALHPGDQMARGFLSMVRIAEEDKFLFELPGLLGGEGGSFPSWADRISASLRASVAADGFRCVLERFLALFRTLLADFDMQRMMMALDAAAAFDASGKRDIAEFLHSLDCMEAKSSSIRKTVQFMTIYKSKGLDFDLVIVPELYTNNGIDTGSRELIVKKDAAFRPEWVTHAPRKAFLPFFPAVAEADAVLNEDSTYENCCLLYVAMTRARHALYLMIPDEKGGGNSFRYPDLLRATLEETPDPEHVQWLSSVPSEQKMTLLYSVGDPRWLEKKSSGADSRAPFLIRAEERLFALEAGYLAQRDLPVQPPEQSVALSPSVAGEKGKEGAPATFSAGEGAAMGSLIHALFAKVEFLDDCDPEQLLSEYLGEVAARTTPEERRSIAALFRHALSSPGAALLRRPADGGRVEVWREKHFSVRMNGELVSGVFDRVVIFRNEAGCPVRIQLVDYKSDASDDPELYRNLYAGQLEMYADVLTCFFHLPVERVIFMIRSGKSLIL